MTTPLERDTRRATVRQLADEGMSQRRIARRLGISKDTVRRDLADLADAAAPPGEPPATAATSACAIPAPGDEPQEPEACATAPPDDAPPAPEPAPPAPIGEPCPDEWIAIGLDDDLRDDLAVLQSTGRTLSAAIREAVALLADAHHTAWDANQCPRGTAPRIYGANYRPYSLPPTPDNPAADLARTYGLDKIAT